MNKRIRKKMYQEYIQDVLDEISLSDVWRERLINAEHNTPILMLSALHDLSPYVACKIKKYNLKYAVIKQLFEDDDDEAGNYGLFTVYSTEFPTIYASSFNNLDII